MCGHSGYIERLSKGMSIRYESNCTLLGCSMAIAVTECITLYEPLSVQFIDLYKDTPQPHGIRWDPGQSIRSSYYTLCTLPSAAWHQKAPATVRGMGAPPMILISRLEWLLTGTSSYWQRHLRPYQWRRSVVVQVQASGIECAILPIQGTGESVDLLVAIQGANTLSNSY